MATKIRKQIYLEPDQETLLKQLSRTSGVTEADLIRQAIDRHILGGQPSRRDLRAWEAEHAYIAGLIAQGSVEGARRWRREDIYER